MDKRRAHILIGHYEIIYKLVRVVLSSVFHLYKGMGLFLFPAPGNKDFTSTRKYRTEAWILLNFLNLIINDINALLY